MEETGLRDIKELGVGISLPYLGVINKNSTKIGQPFIVTKQSKVIIHQ